MKNLTGAFLCLSVFLSAGRDAQAQAYEGLTLFQPNSSNTAYLINMDGTIHHTWVGSAGPGLSVYLLPDGDLLLGGLGIEHGIRHFGRLRR